MNIIMLGAPGTGKGTVAGILREKLNLVHLSSGDIFRECIAKKDDLAKELDEYLAQGKLVPDELTIRIIGAKLQEPEMKNGIILDGFPRTIEQAKQLDKFYQEQGQKIDLVINLTSQEDEIIERISFRRICSNQDCKAVFNLKLNPPKVDGVCDFCGSELTQRKDDNPETIKSRLATYFETTSPLVDFYKEKGVLYTAEVSEKKNKLGKDVAEDVINYIKENK